MENSAASITYLRVMVTIVPAFGLFASAFIMRYFDIDSRKHQLIVEQIHRREAGEVFDVVDPLAPGYDNKTRDRVDSTTTSTSSSTSSLDDSITPCGSGFHTPTALDPGSISATTIDIFGHDDDDVRDEEEEEREKLFLYFSTTEMWLLTKRKGIRAVIHRYIIDTLLVVLYLLLLTFASVKTLCYAVHDSTNTIKSSFARAEVKKAQYEAQIMVALVMIYSILVFFQLGRARGMQRIRSDDPVDVCYYAHCFLRKHKVWSTKSLYGERYTKAIINRVVMHGFSCVVVVMAVVLSMSLGTRDHLLI